MSEQTPETPESIAESVKAELRECNAPRPVGRPTVRSPDIAERILVKLREGESFNWFDSEQAVGLPSTSTIRRWRAEDEHFDAECARACEIHAEADYDKMQRIERMALRGEIDSKAANTVLSNMRWRMEKRNKARFGQKVELTHNVTDTLADQMKAARERAASSD